MTTVFHDGERVIQTESGVNARSDKMGNKFIRDHIIDQHKVFFESLPYVFVALHDHDAQPWLSIMQGKPGFIHSPDEKTLTLNGKVIGDDVLGLQTDKGKPIGIVGLDLSTRRRNRLNGNFKQSVKNDFSSIAVGHSFGNCPKYIQLRHFESDVNHDDVIGAQKVEVEHFVEFSELDIDLIKQSDTLFIASSDKKGGNLDANHRGGKPGFVRVDNPTQLWFNDYPGNNFFQTFGNIHNHPNVGLLFLDFQSSDLLLMSGKARIEKLGPVEQSINTKPSFLPRRFYFGLDRGIRLKRAVYGRWSLEEMSPYLFDDLD